ncbi:MAG: hypothetical protein A2987_04110 [Omnitrophica bacterium RIFCSPLOWO2_01_FULL_45_10]|nr:MAG: hypothetical protein A2987_04110 [Omnitrophica bacterium RIFCSPLOWO2_01_FULL_45_10]
MKILPIQEAYKRKFERQRAIEELKYDASGHCVHIGRLSPGCYSCFAPDPYRRNFALGIRCNLNCVYCTTDKKEKEISPKAHFKVKAMLYKWALSKNYKPTSMSFTGGGEPLLYLDEIGNYMKILHNTEKQTKHRPWHYLYTNGTLANPDNLARLRDLGFDEIRFHLGASNFSEKVYQNLRKAARYFKAVSVETPSWEPHRKKLFEMLPKIEDMGVKHLNIGEIEVNSANFKKISRIMPEGEIYQCFEMHLYDNGLVYDIIEEVIKRRYSYSVIDCNCFVKSMQRGPAKFVYHEDISGVCGKYKF